MFTEIRLAYRRLANSPGFTSVSLITLALCVGANLAIFAAVDSILLRPLPFPFADQLVTIVNSFPKSGLERDGASVASYYERRGKIPAFSAMSALRYDIANVGEAGSVERMDILRVTPEFFTTLGIGLSEGRPFKDEDMAPQADNVVIVTKSYARRVFAENSQILGREISVDGHKETIVGVIPENFAYLSSDAEIFAPLSSTAEQRGINARYISGYEVIARLKPGASLTEAQAQIDADYAAHSAEFPWAKEIVDAGFRETVTSLQADHVKPIRPTLLLLQAGALLLLAIGAVNLINLLLIRASVRSKEFAIRRSMGANWRHVLRDVMLETFLISVGGTLLGFVVGSWGLHLLAALGANRLPLGVHLAFDSRVAIAALLGAVALGVAISIPIAWFNLHNHLAETLKSESRSGTSSKASRRVRDGFVIAQTAFAFILLTGAGLLGLSLKRVMAVSPGFQPDHILTGQINLPGKTYKGDSARLDFANRLVYAAGHQPGLLNVGIVTDVPLKGADSKSDNNPMTIVGFNYAPGVPPILHNEYGVTGDYFAAMGIPLVEGRFLGSSDSRGDVRSCVVDTEFAHHYWPGGGAIGKRVWEGPPQNRAMSEAFTIVGVVGAVKQKDLADRNANGAIYFPYGYRAAPEIYLVVRTSLPPTSLANPIRQLVRGIDPELAISNVQTMETRMEESLIARRAPALLAAIFAVVALLLAAIGTYGVLSYAVNQRRREIGIRMALGAESGNIRRQFLMIGLRQLCIGAGLGILGVWEAGKVIRSLLFDVPAFDLSTLFATAITLGAIALAACFIPARRASRISPIEALAED